MCHHESTLPKWAQARLATLREELACLQGLKNLTGILDTEKHKWLSIDGPHENSENESTKIWALKENEPLCICSLGKGDVLFVGQQTNVKSKEN